MARAPEDMNLPGCNYQKLHGQPVRHSVHVNGPWCVTFGWEGENAVQVDPENSH